MRKQKIAYKGTTKIANMQIFLYFLLKKVRASLKNARILAYMKEKQYLCSRLC